MLALGASPRTCQLRRALQTSKTTPIVYRTRTRPRTITPYAQATSRTTSFTKSTLAKVGIVAGAAALSLALPSIAHAAATETSSNALSGLISFILHLDSHLSALIAKHGAATYAILWGIVFCETGLVVTPFLPGDSLLFAAGAFAGLGQLALLPLMAVFISSAILGDALNYAIGSTLGTWLTSRGIVNQSYITKTEQFYSKYGGKTIVLARFVPIVRTFAPFVAGVGSMNYGSFALYNVAGALIWTVLFVGAGFFFGNLPVVRHNFTLVVLGIVAVSVVPVVLEILNARREAAGGGEAAGGKA